MNTPLNIVIQRGGCRTRAAIVGGMSVIALVTLFAPVARAATYTWTNPGSDYYTNSANWDQAAVPGSADTALMASGGTALIDSTMSNLLTSMLLGGLDGSAGSVTMTGGNLLITNTTGTTGFLPGYGQNSSGTFTLNGGTLTVARPSTGNKYFQDSFQPGQTIGSTGTVTVNNGTLNILCGLELGIDGAGIITLNGGTLMDNGWITIGIGTSPTIC